MQFNWTSDSGDHHIEIHLTPEDAALLDEQRGDMSIEEYLHALIRAVLLVKFPTNNGDGSGARELAKLIQNEAWVAEFLRILKKAKSEGRD